MKMVYRAQDFEFQVYMAQTYIEYTHRLKITRIYANGSYDSVSKVKLREVPLWVAALHSRLEVEDVVNGIHVQLELVNVIFCPNLLDDRAELFRIFLGLFELVSAHEFPLALRVDIHPDNSGFLAARELQSG